MRCKGNLLTLRKSYEEAKCYMTFGRQLNGVALAGDKIARAMVRE
jgi:hypothetical protein